MTREPREPLAQERYIVVTGEHANGDKVYFADEAGNTILFLSDDGVTKPETQRDAR